MAENAKIAALRAASSSLRRAAGPESLIFPWMTARPSEGFQFGNSLRAQLNNPAPAVFGSWTPPPGSAPGRPEVPPEPPPPAPPLPEEPVDEPDPPPASEPVVSEPVFASPGAVVVEKPSIDIPPEEDVEASVIVEEILPEEFDPQTFVVTGPPPPTPAPELEPPPEPTQQDPEVSIIVEELLPEEFDPQTFVVAGPPPTTPIVLPPPELPEEPEPDYSVTVEEVLEEEDPSTYEELVSDPSLGGGGFTEQIGDRYSTELNAIDNLLLNLWLEQFADDNDREGVITVETIGE